MDKDVSKNKWELKSDVIVIGTGFAGLSAAIEAHDSGANVIILEKMSSPGGNSIIASGGINAVNPKLQKHQGIKDSINLHYNQTLSKGDNRGEPEKIKYLVNNALSVLCWLEDLGVEFPEKVIQGLGAVWERTHCPPNYKNYKKGKAIIEALLDQIKARNISVYYNHKVKEILREDKLKGRVLGVKAYNKNNTYLFRARNGVVLASGGFAANHQEVKKHDRKLEVITASTNNPAASGEVIKMAEDIGCDSIHKSFIQCIPWAVSSSRHKGMFFLISSQESRSYPIPYQIFVNKKGERFVAEDSARNEITKSALSQPTFKPINFKNKGREILSNSIDNLETVLKINPKGSLVDTVKKYNKFCRDKNDEEYGKSDKLLVPLETPPFIAKNMSLARHHTMGGIKTEGVTGKVLDRWGEIVPGLYAAGEVTGGLHGSNRLGHNATPECLIFGRKAGQNAAKSG